MTPDHPAAYGDVFADVYDDWYGDTSEVPDLVETISRLADSGSVLELGGGTGRVAIPLAGTGLRVDTVDASMAMLREGRLKPGWHHLNVVCADMTRLPLRAGYSVVLIAFNTFSNLASEHGQAAALAEAARVLAPDGCLVIDLFVPAADMDPLRVGSVRRDDGRGGTIIASTAVRPELQLVEGQHIHQTAEGQESLRRWVLRYLYPSQLDAMCSEHGFDLESRFADWSGEPFGPASHRHVSVFRRR